MTASLSLRGLARLMGVSEKAVRKALAAGVFSSAAISRDAQEMPIVLNATLAVHEWEKSGRQLRGSRPALPPRETERPPVGEPPAPAAASAAAADTPPREDPVSPSLVEAQTEAMLERGRKLRMENDLREGSLVEASQAARAAFEFARTIREAVLNVPARVAAELAAETDGARVYTRLDAALREALESTAARLDASAAG